MTGGLVHMVDPDDDTPISNEGNGTVYDDLRAALQEEIETKEIPLVVPKRPYVFVLYEPSVEYEVFRKWANGSRDRRTKEVDELKLAYKVLNATCRGVEMERDGQREEVFAPNGDRLTFQSRRLQDMVGASLGGHVDCIRNVYKQDPHIILVMKRIMEESGFADYDLSAGDDDGGPFDV